MKLNPRKERTAPRLWILILLVVLGFVLTTIWYQETDEGYLHKAKITTHSLSAPLGSFGQTVTAPIRRWLFAQKQSDLTKDEAIQLRKQNADLRARIVKLEEENQRYLRVEALLSAEASSVYDGIASSVIGQPANLWEQVITIDKGTEAGFKVSMPVVGPYGLLGQIIEVGKNYSKVRLITDQDSGVSVMFQRTRAQGIVKGSPTGDLSMEFVDNDTDVQKGDVVITSGLGGVFPKGIVVGEVLDAKGGSSSLYQTIRVMTSTNASGTEDVLVLTNSAPGIDTLVGEEQ